MDNSQLYNRQISFFSKNASKLSKCSTLYQSDIQQEPTSPYLKIDIYKLPQKNIEEIAINPERKNSQYNFELNLNYQIIYETISEFYYPVLKNLNNIDVNYSSIISRIERLIQTNHSVFQSHNGKTNFYLTQSKNYEVIMVSLLIFLIQVKNELNYDDKSYSINTHKKVGVFYQKIIYCLKKLYKLAMLFLFFNSNNRGENERNISFRELCMKYVNNNLNKKYFSYSNQNIFITIIKIQNKIANELELISSSIISSMYETSNYMSTFLVNQNLLISLQILEKISHYLSSHQKHKENIDDFFQDDALTLIHIFKEFQSSCKLKVPYLPPLNAERHKFSLVVDLDETLVHCDWDTGSTYVNVRPYLDYFLDRLGDLYEIIIFTASVEEYANFVLEKIDTNHKISHKLYRRHTICKGDNNIIIKDLNKLGRDINKMCIIDNNKDSFSLQPENGLNISTYIGDENDKELLFLTNDLVKLHNKAENNIIPYLKRIRKKMEKRYEERVKY